MAKASGDKTLERKANGTIAVYRKGYDDLCDKVGLEKRYNRMATFPSQSVIKTADMVKKSVVSVSETVKVVDKVLESGIIKEKGFANDDLLKKHLDKHLKEYEGFSPEQYVNRAIELANEPLSENIKGFTTKSGKTYRYDTEKNDFVVRNKNGTISTLFKPKSGIKYWERQLNKHAKP